MLLHSGLCFLEVILELLVRRQRDFVSATVLESIDLGLLTVDSAFSFIKEFLQALFLGQVLYSSLVSLVVILLILSIPLEVLIQLRLQPSILLGKLPVVSLHCGKEDLLGLDASH